MQIINYCKKNLHDNVIDDDLINYINVGYGYLVEFAMNVKPYLDCLGNMLQKHILLIFEDFVCLLNYEGKSGEFGDYTIKIKMNNEIIFSLDGEEVDNFNKEMIDECEIYNPIMLQKIADDYGYDDNVLLVNDIAILLTNLFIDDYISQNSYPGARDHF
jgi:hypothetical protein